MVVAMGLRLLLTTLPLATLLACSSVASDVVSPKDPFGPLGERWDDRLSIAVEGGVTDIVPRTLRARARVTNESGRPLGIEYGACSLTLFAYASADRRGEPVWTSWERWHPLFDGFACPAYLASDVLAPGETVSPGEFTVAIPIYQIVGDGLGGEPPLAPGRYHLFAVLRLNDRVSPAIPLGSVDLPADVEPIPAQVEIDGIRYAAGIDRPASDSLVFRVSITNRRSMPAVVGTGDGRSVATTLLGYTSPLRRDTWYRHRDADWAATRRPYRPPVTLAPDETFVLEQRMEIMPPPERVHLVTFLWSVVQDGEMWGFALAPGVIE